MLRHVLPLSAAVLTLTSLMGCAAHDALDVRDTTADRPTVTLLATGYVAPIDGRNFVPGQTDDGARRVASSIVLVQADGATIVADPGMIADRAILTAALRKVGVDPADVTHVFWSHHHPDHTVNSAMFPNARVVDFWAVYDGDLWEDHGDDFALAPGVRVLQTPGHTAQDASLLIDTADGTYALTHLWWNEKMEPKTDPLAQDQDALESHRETILETADWIIPGHGKPFRNPRRQ